MLVFCVSVEVCMAWPGRGTGLLGADGRRCGPVLSLLLGACSETIKPVAMVAL